MLELPFLRENRDEAEARLGKRNIDAKGLVVRLLELDEERRKVQLELDGKLAELNRMSRQIGELMRAGKKEEAEQAKIRTGELKTSIDALQGKMTAAEKSAAGSLGHDPERTEHKGACRKKRRG
jgi:seryl-tRNA synthetase